MRGLSEQLNGVIHYVEILFVLQISCGSLLFTACFRPFRWTIPKAELEPSLGWELGGQGILSDKIPKQSAMVIPGKAL